MVKIYSRLLVQRFGLGTPEEKESATFVRQGVKRMEQLIKDLLSYSRTIQPAELTFETADLNEALGEALAGLQPGVEESGAGAVRSNGIGFEQHHAEHTFSLFKRLHKDEYPATGLGLAICKCIVERYGGRMWAGG